MIHLVDQALEAFLRRQVPLPAGEVDVSFDAPDRRWGASITRPTINVFLWDVRRAPHKSRSGMFEWEEDGKVYRQRPPRWVELCYLVTAWASEQRDEHQLLGSVMQTVIRHGSIDADLIPPALAHESPKVGVSLGAAAEQRTSDFWSALDGQLKPGLQVKASVTIPVAPPEEAAAPARERELGMTNRRAEPGHGRSTVADAVDPADDSRRRVRRRRGEIEEGIGQPPSRNA